MFVKNRSIVEISRSMLKDKGLPNTFCGKAITIFFFYFFYRCPTRSVQNMIPYQGWTRRKLSVVYFKVIDCIAYAHVHFQK